MRFLVFKNIDLKNTIRLHLDLEYKCSDYSLYPEASQWQDTVRQKWSVRSLSYVGFFSCSTISYGSPTSSFSDLFHLSGRAIIVKVWCPKPRNWWGWEKLSLSMASVWWLCRDCSLGVAQLRGQVEEAEGKRNN